MAKLEEIAELLTEEIDGFNKSIKKLEEIKNQINSYKFESDISNIRYQIEEQKKELKDHSKYQNQKMDEISKKMSKARIFPNWLVILFFVLMIIFLGIIILLLSWNSLIPIAIR